MENRYFVGSLSVLRPWHLATVIVLVTSTVCSSANAVIFTPPSRNSAPSQSTGGASRSSFFTPSRGNGAPRQATGGASRGGFFTPSRGNGAPRQATGGASRGNLFTPNKGNSAPRQASGGASRVGTYYLSPSTVAATGPAALIGLMPQSYYGTTVSERPAVMIYLPASDAKEAVFSIKDETGNMHHSMTIPVAGKSGVVAVKLPEEAAALTVGKNYQWFFALKVNGQLSPSTPYVDGWIQRIQPSAELATAIQQQDALKRAEALGKNGVWYDCVATLAALHASQPNNPTISKQWGELLASVSLKEIATAPLVVSAN
ncbi:DUF928 domain-containing protein [Calothrix sp. UHCC 0171]|uniref:DUF928 domain-containing protein n=1 Tax=Calothrix sp. UHCC 0171 TaxID=3110245 RepID=UPI002B217512|nr:DUF928 domain-containing protein [Calothrix sp. UHCC 0171]MEA5574605.1 DUF928 domain-containing protein [Calothrix sp. UHCC 0171]